MKISVIVPTYNEAENIRKLIPLLDSVLKDYDYEIVVVDDNNPDGTAKVAKKLAGKYPVRVLKRVKKARVDYTLWIIINTNRYLRVIDANLQGWLIW